MDIWRPLPPYWFKHVVGLFKYIHSMTCFYPFCGLLSTIMTLWSASHSPDWPLSLFYRLTLHLHFVVVPISLLFRTARIILLLFYSITLLISCMKLLRLFNFLLFLLLNSMYVLYTFGFLIVCFLGTFSEHFQKGYTAEGNETRLREHCQGILDRFAILLVYRPIYQPQ